MNPDPPELPSRIEDSAPDLLVPEALAAKEAAALARPTAKKAGFGPPAPDDNRLTSVLGEAEAKQIAIDQRREFDRLSIEEKTLLNKSLLEDIQARRKYATGIFSLIIGWLIAILIVLLLQGFLAKNETALTFSIWHYGFTKTIHFELSDPVLLALIGGTTASVLGLFVIVANYFFPKRVSPSSN